MKLCDYGCGQEGKFQFKNDKWCCSKHSNKCPSVRKNLSVSHIGKTPWNKGLTLGKQSDTLIKRRTRNSKNKRSMLSYYKKNHPLLFQIEKIFEGKRKNIYVECKKCGSFFIARRQQIYERLRAIEKQHGCEENNFYCSDECKNDCEIFRKRIDPYKNKKIDYSREVQPELRELRLEIDNYQCQKCGCKDKEMHCHHIEGIRWEPIESADLDMVITYCKDCHYKVHKIEGCSYSDLQCNI